ncbi:MULTISPECIES: SDR family NAD(P)-dependent oxidoreductase [Cohnella]|uniref:SDR family NAD(P)-dependent oxidoreductase n=1 Tax=Cohnella TaxID=329857 RepID=UPI001967F690|nr:MULTISPECIES: SDR family NAD(P)-dependent oxidoreductase [Cohnella]MBN2980078.1 SDR family NAD(P)-dependent oxidoreductase [Cohnella algarum]
MTGKICLVTGANSGIGKATALGLAKSGAHVVMTARDRKRGEEAREEVIRLSGNRKVELLLADLTAGDGIRSLASQYLSRHDNLHVLINNAGGVFKDYRKNAEGMELTFALNYYAPFLLTQLLLETLKKSSPARIINVASEMQAVSLDFEKLIDPGDYRAMNVYRAAKLAVVMFTYALARKLSGTAVTVNAVHPGVIYTPQSARMVPSFLRPLLKLFMSAPEKGARPSLRLAMDPSLEGATGHYYNRETKKQTGPFSYDIQQQEMLYERSLALCGLG